MTITEQLAVMRINTDTACELFNEACQNLLTQIDHFNIICYGK